MAARSFAYHAHGTADSDKSCCYPWFVCHDKTLDQQCMLVQARAPMRNHLTSKDISGVHSVSRKLNDWFPSVCLSWLTQRSQKLRNVRGNECCVRFRSSAKRGGEFFFYLFIYFIFLIFIFIFFYWVCIFRSFSDLPNCPVSFMWKTARLYWLCRRSLERPYSTFDDVAHWRCSPSHHHCISGNVCIQLYMGLFQRRGCLNLALLRRKLG